MTETASGSPKPVTTRDLALPPSRVRASQDREWCVVDVDGEWKKIRFHDYDEIYAIPGLYETLFYEVLRCDSPAKVCSMLGRCLVDAGVAPESLRVLDLGAGNGMVGEELAKVGVRRLVGVDNIPEAAEAAHRDRRNLYESYVVADMSAPTPELTRRLDAFGFNCLTCVAALGFGDIPTEVFFNACNFIDKGGFLAFNIKSAFLESKDPSGFARLIRRMVDDSVVTVLAREEYRHRLATSGQPLEYTGIIATKNRDIPGAWVL